MRDPILLKILIILIAIRFSCAQSTYQLFQSGDIRDVVNTDSVLVYNNTVSNNILICNTSSQIIFHLSSAAQDVDYHLALWVKFQNQSQGNQTLALLTEAHNQLLIGLTFEYNQSFGYQIYVQDSDSGDPSPTTWSTAGSLAHPGVWLFVSLYKKHWGGTLTGTVASIRDIYNQTEEILTPYNANLSQGLQTDFQLYIGGMSNDSSTICFCSVNGVYLQIFYDGTFLTTDQILFLATQFRARLVTLDFSHYDENNQNIQDISGNDVSAYIGQSPFVDEFDPTYRRTDQAFEYFGNNFITVSGVQLGDVSQAAIGMYLRFYFRMDANISVLTAILDISSKLHSLQVLVSATQFALQFDGNNRVSQAIALATNQWTLFFILFGQNSTQSVICYSYIVLPPLPYAQLWKPDARLQIQLGGSSSLQSYWTGAITALEVGLGMPVDNSEVLPKFCIVYFGDSNITNLDQQVSTTGLSCLACNIGWLNYNETCFTACPEGTLATSYQVCAECYEGCNTCNSLATTGCTSCADGWQPLPQNTTANSGGCFKTVKCGECDDGNNIDGDGCSSSCQVEPGWYCITNQYGLSDCEQCDPFCANCSSQAGCIACMDYYVLITQSCYLYGCIIQAKYAYFQEENNQIIVKFNRVLNVQANQDRACSEILDTNTIQIIGNDSCCEIDSNDPSVLIITLNSDIQQLSTLLAIGFRTQAVFQIRGCNQTGLQNLSIVVAGLLTAQTTKNVFPTPLIVTIGNYLPISLDLRPFLSQLILDNLSVNVAEYNSQSNQSIGNSKLSNGIRSALINGDLFYKITPSALTNGSQYFVAISFNNLFSSKITSKFNIFKESHALPVVSVEGGLLQYWYTWQEIVIRIIIEEPLGSDKFYPQQYSVQWNSFQVSNQLLLNTLLPSTSFYLRIPPFTLSPGLFGLIIVTVTNNATQILYQATIRLIIRESPIQYTELMNVQASYLQELVIDGSSYFDPDKNVSEHGNGFITWMCIDFLNYPCRSSQNSSQILALANNTSTSPGMLVIPACQLGENFTLVLGIEFAGDYFCFEAFVVPTYVSYTNNRAFEITVLEGQNSFSSFNQMMPIWIQISSIFPVDLWEWTLTPQDAVSNDLDREIYQIAVSIISDSDFRIDYSWLNSSLIAMSQFYINPSPTNGSLSISPGYGTAFLTEFLIEIAYWDDAQLPLSYSVFLQDPSSDWVWRLSLPQSSPRFTTLLPIGNIENNYQIWIKINVSDALGSTTTIEKRVFITNQFEFQDNVLTQMSQVNPSKYFPSLSILGFCNEMGRPALSAQIRANALANIISNLNNIPPYSSDLNDVFSILESLTLDAEYLDQSLVVNITSSLPNYLALQTPTKIQGSSLLILQTLSNLLEFVKSNCQQGSVLNQMIFNSSIEVVNILTSSIMQLPFSWERFQNLSSDLITLYGTQLTSESQANQLIKVNDDSPLIQLNASNLFLPNGSNSSQYTLQILILDTQLIECVKMASNGTQDISNVMITINSTDNGTSDQISQVVPFTIYYNSSNDDPCIESLNCELMSPSVDIKGKTYTSCACKDVNTFSISYQLSNLFEISNWNKLTNLEGLQTFNPTSSPVFYIMMASCSLTIIMSSLGEMWDAKLLFQSRPKRTRLTVLRKIWECYAAGHPFFSIILYYDEIFPRWFRFLLFELRLMIFMAISAFWYMGKTKSDYTNIEICIIFAISLVISKVFLKIPAYFFKAAQKAILKSIREDHSCGVAAEEAIAKAQSKADEPTANQTSITPKQNSSTRTLKGPRRQLTNKVSRARFLNHVQRQNFVRGTTDSKLASFEANSQTDLDITVPSQRIVTPTSTEVQMPITPISGSKYEAKYSKEPSICSQTLKVIATAFPFTLVVSAFIIILIITANTSQDASNVWVRNTMISWGADFLGLQFFKGLVNYILIKIVAPNNPKRGRIFCPDFILKHFINHNILQRMKEIDNIEKESDEPAA